jgi:4-amino-4-deoxy-L-arabinose transferase-like glycosyltransferase
VAARAVPFIVSIGAAAIGLRLLFGLTYWVGKPLTHDEREYLSLADNLAAGRGFIYGPDHDWGTAQQFGRAPLYPMFLAAIGAADGTTDATPTRVKVAQAALGGLLVALIGAIALHAAGPRAGVLAAAVAAVYPPLVWYPAYVLSETLYSALALTAVLLLQIAVERSDQARSSRAGGPLALLSGLLVGLAVLTRPALLFFVPLAVVWLAVRRRPVLALAMVAAALAVVAPWTARNYRVHGRFVLVASEGGVTFWTGNHPLARGEGDLAANPELKRAELEFRRAHPGLSSEELEPLYYRAAFRHITNDVGWWLGLLAKKAFYTVVPVGPSYRVHSMRYQIASIGSYLLLVPFAAFGARGLWHSSRRPTPLLLLAASAVLVCLIFFPQERFRVPVVDPSLIVCAAAGGRRTEQ